MTLLDDRMANAGPKIKAIVELIAEQLEVYPGDEAMRLIHKLLDIIDSEDGEL